MKDLSPLRRKDIEAGRKLEREAIVAWLWDAWRNEKVEIDGLDIADAIEAGEHLK